MNILERLIAERRAAGLVPAPTASHLVLGVDQLPAPPPPPAAHPPNAPLEVTNPTLARILALTGQTLETLRAEVPGIPEGGNTEPEAVLDTPELRRILDLPRRSLDSGEALAEQMTEAFRTPWGQWKLRPIQALALHDIHQYRGLFGPIRVGAGKTLISYMAPEMAGAKRPLLVVPAKLRAKTKREFRILAQHWMGPHPDTYRVESYELLGRPQAGGKLDEKGKLVEPGFLEKYRPDIIVLDEAHKLKNKSAAVTRRVRRYVEANPHVVVIALSGTITKRSLKDFAHVAQWCLPRTCPVPRTHSDLEAWAGALDEKVDAFRRVEPGALYLFCEPSDQTPIRLRNYAPDLELSKVRQAFRKRMVETPGVVATQEGPMDMSLDIPSLEVKQSDPQVDHHFHILRSTYCTPTGIDCPDGITLKRHALEMALGFEYIWDPQPPEEWREVRKAWSKFCREVIKWNRRGIDSEKQVKDAVDKGLYDDGGLLNEWRKMEPTFTPNTVPVWFSSEALETAAAWMEDNAGIVWCGHVAFAEALAKLTKVPYYGREGRDWANTARPYIEDHPKGKPLIASISSNSEGRNLQYKWSTNLVMSWPRSGLTCEQLLGRTHRDGQEADEVTAWCFVNCVEHVADFWQSVSDAKMQQDVTGQAQKLQYATKGVPDVGEIGDLFGARWGLG